MIKRWIPGARLLATYRGSWLRRDMVAGLVLSTLLVPQGMAYAELAGLPVITGLYTTVACLIGYVVFGPSRILVLGPDSSLGPMIAATILPIVGSSGNPEHAVALASMLALLVGAIMIAAGIAKLGFVADLLSKPTQIGYMNGLALTILIGQLPKLFGFSVGANGLIDETHAFVHGLASDEAIIAAAAMGLVSLRSHPRPWALVATDPGRARCGPGRDRGVCGARPRRPRRLARRNALEGTPATHAAQSRIRPAAARRRRFGHRARRAHRHNLHRFGVRRTRTGQDVDGSGEMIGIGAANVAAGFFQGFPVSTSGSRTAVAEQAAQRHRSVGSWEPQRSC